MEETTKTRTQERTQHHMTTTTTSPPSPASKLQPSSPQTCDSHAQLLRHQHALELEGLCEDHGVRSCTITNSHFGSTATGKEAFSFFSISQSLPALPAHTSEFALQVVDLTEIWSNEITGNIENDDLLAMAVAVYLHIKLHFTPQQRYPRSLPELLTAFAALLL